MRTPGGAARCPGSRPERRRPARLVPSVRERPTARRLEDEALALRLHHPGCSLRLRTQSPNEGTNPKSSRICRSPICLRALGARWRREHPPETLHALGDALRVVAHQPMAQVVDVRRAFVEPGVDGRSLPVPPHLRAHGARVIDRVHATPPSVRTTTRCNNRCARTRSDRCPHRPPRRRSRRHCSRIRRGTRR